MATTTTHTGSQDPIIITMNDRGQITIPKKMRGHKRHYSCLLDDEGDLILRPMQTREEFLAELDEAMEDYEKHGGYTLEEMRKMHNL